MKRSSFYAIVCLTGLWLAQTKSQQAYDVYVTETKVIYARYDQVAPFPGHPERFWARNHHLW